MSLLVLIMVRLREARVGRTKCVDSGVGFCGFWMDIVSLSALLMVRLCETRVGRSKCVDNGVGFCGFWMGIVSLSVFCNGAFACF